MIKTDEWGKDPSVRIMRSIFRSIETGQKEFITRLGIDDQDHRLRHWRDNALPVFEKSWRIAGNSGISMDEKTASALYIHSLAKVMAYDGIEIPPSLLPDQKQVEAIFREEIYK